METRKILLMALFIVASLSSFSQNKFNLLPDNMIKYIGKTDRASFEKVVGSPVGEEEGGFIVYEVENTYDNEITAIRCFYRESDGKLISVKFGTPHYLGYWIKFGEFKSYNEKLHCKTTKVAGTLTKVELKLNGFGCQILDITKVTPQVTTAVINYHTVK